MKISDNALKSGACWFGVIMFYSIPLVRIVIGDPFGMIQFGLSIVIGFGFAIAGGYYLDQYKKEKRKQQIISDEDTNEFIDTNIGEKCPKCKSKLMMISRLDGKLLNDAWIGLIYCMNCNFEISKERWDNGERDP